MDITGNNIKELAGKLTGVQNTNKEFGTFASEELRDHNGEPMAMFNGINRSVDKTTEENKEELAKLSPEELAKNISFKYGNLLGINNVLETYKPFVDLAAKNNKDTGTIIYDRVKDEYNSLYSEVSNGIDKERQLATQLLETLQEQSSICIPNPSQEQSLLSIPKPVEEVIIKFKNE